MAIRALFYLLHHEHIRSLFSLSTFPFMPKRRASLRLSFLITDPFLSSEGGDEELSSNVATTYPADDKCFEVQFLLIQYRPQQLEYLLVDRKK